MNRSQSSSNSYSQPGNKYANVVTTVSLAAFLLLWGLVWNRLEKLDGRMRNIELEIVAIRTAYEIKDGKVGLNPSLQGLSGHAIGLEPGNSP
jgi:hypothetical protein